LRLSTVYAMNAKSGNKDNKKNNKIMNKL